MGVDFGATRHVRMSGRSCMHFFATLILETLCCGCARNGVSVNTTSAHRRDVFHGKPAGRLRPANPNPNTNPNPNPNTVTVIKTPMGRWGRCSIYRHRFFMGHPVLFITIKCKNLRNKDEHKPLIQIIFSVVEPDSNLQRIAVTNEAKYIIHYSEGRISPTVMNDQATIAASSEYLSEK